MQALQYKTNATGFIHGFRYNIRTLVEVLCCREDGISYPFQEFEPTAEAIGDHINYRVNTTSAMYQQYADMCDVIVLPDKDDKSSKAKIYQELNLNYVKEHFMGKRYFVVYLDYGKREVEGSVFVYVIQANPSCPEKSTFLHPILLAFDEEGNEYDKTHILEALETVWDDPEIHGVPIKKFV
jgi:hypothetical protein